MERSTSGGVPPCVGGMKRRSNIFSPHRCYDIFASGEGPPVPANYCYRLLNRATWGIAIDVRGETVPLPPGPLPPGVDKVAEGFWLEADIGWLLTEEELRFLKLGLLLVAAEIEKRRCEAHPCLCASWPWTLTRAITNRKAWLPLSPNGPRRSSVSRNRRYPSRLTAAGIDTYSASIAPIGARPNPPRQGADTSCSSDPIMKRGVVRLPPDKAHFEAAPGEIP